MCHKVKIQIESTWEDHVTLSIYPKNSQFVGKLEKEHSKEIYVVFQMPKAMNTKHLRSDRTVSSEGL